MSSCTEDKCELETVVNMTSEFVRKIHQDYMLTVVEKVQNLAQVSSDNYANWSSHTKAILSGILLTLFGIVVLSWDSVNSKPGTVVIRDKIFGIEQRYFLVYFNGLLFYLYLVFSESVGS